MTLGTPPASVVVEMATADSDHEPILWVELGERLAPPEDDDPDAIAAGLAVLEDLLATIATTEAAREVAAPSRDLLELEPTLDRAHRKDAESLLATPAIAAAPRRPSTGARGVLTPDSGLASQVRSSLSRATSSLDEKKAARPPSHPGRGVIRSSSQAGGVK